jgi:aminodeoxyfutalosine synthase
MKAYWIMLGLGTAQTALSYGADDLDGTVRHELIYHDAGATTPELLTVEQIRRSIIEAGREPVERDTLYRRIERDPANPAQWTVGEAIAVAYRPQLQRPESDIASLCHRRFRVGRLTASRRSLRK